MLGAFAMVHPLFCGSIPAMAPVLGLSHDWHRARALQRSGKGKPPPLVAAGLDVELVPRQSGLERTVKVGGMAIVFGAFPPSLPDLVGFARSRLFLQPEQARALDPVLRTRILALWAWLPGLRQDCYLEFDRATDEAHAWCLMPDGAHEIDLSIEQPALDAAFLEALVLSGPTSWGGEGGLGKLTERFGNHHLLVAARVAERLDRRSRDPRGTLELAHAAWPRLSERDETGWADLAEQVHPWVAVQLGRLALRLGLTRAARVLLMRADGTEAPPIAWFDLGQANEALDDLPAAVAGFVHYVGIRPSDPDGWRRLLICRLRQGDLQVADEALRRWREAGGKDDDLAERLIEQVMPSRMRLHERAAVSGWLGARLDAQLGASLSAEALVEACCTAIGPDRAEVLRAAWAQARPAIAEDAARLGEADLPTLAARADALARTALLALPLLARPHPAEEAPSTGDLAGNAQRALSLWCEHRLKLGLRWLAVPQWLERLAAAAHG
jgi:tetratricopeptide (TPR) repeat protein